MKKVVVIVGPTGVGKSKTAVALAKSLQGEIISGDSMQVYKEMTIGTAKITENEMQGVKHYLVNDRSYKDEYNVKIFQQQARSLIDEIHRNDKIPILCGGTGLYIKAVLYDYEFHDQEEDTSFLSFLQERSNSELYVMLRVVDERSLDTIHKNNRQRMIRALMIAHSGEKKSSIVASQEHKEIYDSFIIGLTMDRESLYETINLRVDEMMRNGLLEELHSIVEDESTWSLQSMQGIGYKEWKPYFNKEQTVNECVEAIKKNSRNFAKRQYTWFRNQMQVHWYDIKKEDWKEELERELSTWMEQ